VNNKIVLISLLAVSLSACTDEVGEGGEHTEKTESALSGGPWTWVDAATLLCLDSNTSGSVYTQSCNSGAFQLWTNTPLTFGDQIRDLATGFCLDSNTSGTVYTLPCNNGAFQQWIVSFANGWQIKDVATGLCLDSNTSGSVYTQSCNNGTFQRWH